MQKSIQTGVYFTDVISEEILHDVCFRITGLNEFTFSFVDNDYEDDFLSKGYNMGRICIMQHLDTVSYISFSEREIVGRNSSVQSVPTAFNMYFMNPYQEKKLYYYFINVGGNVGTDYQMLIYRLMKTIGFNFLNDKDALNQTIVNFSTIEDIIHTRSFNAGRNKSNNSSYITKSGFTKYEIYGKTYGANKYETSLISYALSILAKPEFRITLFEMLEGDLHELPKPSLDVLNKMAKISIIPTDMQLEKRVFFENNSLRSPRYTFNLLERLGNKHCTFCNCEIPELIQGAHIWPVSDIKKAPGLSLDDKLTYALDGDNGIWLCENHHKLFDEGLITILENGSIVYDRELEHNHIIFIDSITTQKQLPENLLVAGFLRYLALRNNLSA